MRNYKLNKLRSELRFLYKQGSIISDYINNSKYDNNKNEILNLKIKLTNNHNEISLIINKIKEVLNGR